MQALLDVILPVFLVIGTGYFAVWRGFLQDDQIDGLMKFAQNFAIPALLFKAMVGLDLRAGFDVPLLFSFYAGSFTCFFLGLSGARFVFGRAWPDSVAIGFCCLFSNSVLLGLPITERAYGADALEGNFAIVALHAPFAYLVGVTVMEIVRGQGASAFATMRSILSSMFHNVFVLALALGLVVNLSSVPLPGVVDDALSLLAQAGLPAALFALGGILVRYRPEGDAKIIAMICLISLAIHPALSFALSTRLELNTDALRSVVLTAAMAPGINGYIFANMYGVAKRVAASSVLISTAISVLTIWCWLLILP